MNEVFWENLHRFVLSYINDILVYSKIDASTNGTGAVLSQQQGKPSRLFPCAVFFPKALTSRTTTSARESYYLSHWL